MQFIGFIIFRLALLIFYFIPFSVLYKLSDGVAWLLRVIVKYRVKVVRANLLKAFPEKTETERTIILVAFYKNLADIFLESLKGMTMNWSKPNERYIFPNPEILKPYTQKNLATIHIATHNANWEWATYSYTLYFQERIVAFYKPLSNKFMEAFVLKKRSSTRLVLADIKNTPQHFINNLARGTDVAFALVSDQSPTSKNSIWIKFFGIETAFLHGAQFYALKYSLPVFYLSTKRLRRGYYALSLELITENANNEPENFVTKKYAELLERDIRNAPSDWLWTHKRWKLTK